MGPGDRRQRRALAFRTMPAPRRLDGVRVDFVLNWPDLGGSELQALLLARHLTEVEGAEVEVQALTDRDGRAAERFRELDIPWRGCRANWERGTARTMGTLARIALRLRRSRPDVLLPYCELPNVACGLVWRSTGASTCIWNQRDTLPFTLGDRLVHRAIRSTPTIVSNSCHGAEHLATLWGAPRDRLHVVGNGVALRAAHTSRAEWRARLGTDDADVVVCALAHFYERKDHGTLLRAWRVANDRLEGRSAGVLVLAGRFEGRRDALEALARNLGIDRSVRFLGEVYDVAGLLGASDAGVLSSPTEGCPNALLECMAAGLPVAGTDVPGIREAVGDHGLQLLARGGDAEGLGEALTRLALDRELRETLGTLNRERARRQFGVERMLDESVALILRGLQRPDAS